MLGKFNWLPRGPGEVTPYRTDLTGTGVRDGTGGNSFSIWITGTSGLEPHDRIAMNCWESVLYCYYQAGLITRGELRAAYMTAISKAHAVLGELHLKFQQGPADRLGADEHVRIARAYAAYRHELDRRFFGASQAVEVNRQAGLIPQAGDLLFRGGEIGGHVCIALGRNWGGTNSEDSCMSLWTHNGGHFAKLTLRDLCGSENELTFRPIPHDL
jgi:hypothetical protein